MFHITDSNINRLRPDLEKDSSSEEKAIRITAL